MAAETALDLAEARGSAAPARARRLLFIDNIRWTMIILVLSMHASDTYSPFGNWYYTEHPPIGVAGTVAFGFYQSFLQAFFMALLFLVSAVFAAPSFDRRGPRAFVGERFVRLIIPTLLYMFVIGPLTQYFLSRTWGTGGFLYQWQLHIRDGQILSETGPMWFAAVLFLFSAVYAGLRASGVVGPARPGALPGTRDIVLFIALMALATFAVRIALPETVSVLNTHPGDFPQYALAFAVGIVAGYRGWLTDIPARFGARWAVALIALSLVIFPVLMTFGGALEGHTQNYSGGANFTSLAKCLWEAIVCVGMIFGLVILFRERFDRQGKLAKALSDNAFAVYLIHPPILIALALSMHGFEAPALVKAALLTALATVVTFSLSWLVVRRIPLLERIL